MKFKDKYPNMLPVHEEHEMIIRGSKEIPCHQCGELTEYIEINYQGALCSEECLDEMDDEYFGWCFEPDETIEE